MPFSIKVKPLPAPAAHLLAQLTEPHSWRERLGHDDQKIRALTGLLEHACPAIVPHVAPLALARSGAVRRAAESVLERALATATAADLLELDKICRRRTDYPNSGNEWDAFSPMRLSVLEKFGRVGLGALGVASFHASGYVRESAVRYLDARSEGRELAFLLVRLNDWVAPVAQRAREAVERRILPDYARPWLTWLPLLLRLGRGTRRKPGDLAERVLGILRAPEQRAVVLEEVATGSRPTRRLALRLLSEVESPSDERVFVFATALRDPDTTLRIQAVAYAQSHLSEAELESNVPRMLADRYSPVRRAALNAVAERLSASANRWLVKCLLDRAASVREVGRYHLERRGELTDFAAHYRRELAAASTTASLAAAAAGLGETGNRADAATLTPLLAHEIASVRRAAARALGSLDLDGEAARLLSVLDDSSPGVARVARDALHRRTAVLDTKAVRHLIANAVHLHGRLGGVALAAALPKWESIPLLLEAAASSEDELRAEATQRIADWLEQQNRSFAAPSDAQLEAFHAALHTHSTVLPPGARKNLAAVLEYWASQ